MAASAASDRASSGPVTSAVGRRRFIAGDPIRGIAATVVMVGHAIGFGVAATGGFRAALWVVEDVAVLLFFVLSGYFISLPFVRALVNRERMPSLRSYLVRRGLRIVPASWVVVLAVAFVTVPTHGGRVGTGSLASVLGFAQDYFPSPLGDEVGQGWSLDIEVGFYLLIPLLGACGYRALHNRGSADAR